ncbi:MAG: molybdenum cofactor guanylyltransferase [Bradyrhizobium sp.]|uniref:molybdenum cofactor guanylyltransferase n=1 Tax=Bradyrhizobium sp. TaxID=376 RepID=UPI00391C934D
MTEPVPPTSIPGVLLAGGLARRMGGGDKPIRMIGGRTLLQRVISRLAPQCSRLILNANGDPARFAAYGLTVVRDGVAGFPGPLAGILAGLDWVAAPSVARALALAESGGQTHPVIGLWPVSLREDLRHALVAEDIRKVTRFTARYQVARVSWPVLPFDPFFNANTAADLAEAERLAAQDD